MEEALIYIFERLEKWRRFPKYQLERRLDIFISVYLPEILKMSDDELKDVDINEIKNNIYPEFPLKKVKNCASNNADYAIFIEKTKTIYLVELKTDMNSINDNQLNYYLRYYPKLNRQDNETIIKSEEQIKENSKQIIENIFYDLVKIENKSTNYKKYDYLLNELIYGNPLKYVENNRQWLIKENNKDKEQQKDLEEKKSKFENVKIIFITPKKDDKIKGKFKEDDKTKKLFIEIEFKDIINILNLKENKNLISEKLCNLLDVISKDK